MKSNPDYEMLLREYYEGILLFDIMEREVWNRASADSIGQRKYYDEHTGNFMAGERIQAEIYIAGSPDDIAALKLALLKNDSVMIQDNLAARKIRMEKRAYQKDEKPVLSSIALTPGIHTAENSGMYYLVRIFEVLEPGAVV